MTADLSRFRLNLSVQVDAPLIRHRHLIEQGAEIWKQDRTPCTAEEQAALDAYEEWEASAW